MTAVGTTVLCFGELLWDLLPHGRFAGGAPCNVAYHLHQLGMQPHIVSAVGRDALGDELMRIIRGWGLDPSGIAQLADAPTGTVNAEISPEGDAHYTIATSVAWDAIPVDAVSLARAGTARAIVFGSLAQRAAANRASRAALVAALPASAERVFDVNLREPHDDLTLVRHLARDASLLKLNHHEAARLAGLAAEADPERCARRLAADTGCSQICITAGAGGAGFLEAGRWFFETAQPVQVRDTVGAGDAFLAAFLTEYLATRDGAAALRRGCRLAEWVASQPGATAVHPKSY